jgi:hypothetical protein
MKKIILAGIGGLFLALPIADNVYAVWPPSTALEEETNAAASTAPAQSLGSELPRPRSLTDRLEDDERRLHDVLLDLEKDSKDLKRSSDTAGTGEQK